MAIQIAWSKHRDDDFDLKQFASGLLKRAEQSLQEDGYVQSAVFLITNTDVQCCSVEFDGHGEKEASYEEVVRKAHEIEAEAIVTLNDAYMGEKYDPATYEWGQAAKDPKGECLFVTISGPGLQNWTKEIEYRRGPDGIVFSPLEEESNSFIGFLGEWSRKGQRVN
jgi:hypothetical protein